MTIRVTVRTVLISLAATLTVYVAYQFVSLRSQNNLTSVPRSDSIVILGAAVWPGGQPHTFSETGLRVPQSFITRGSQTESSAPAA